MMRVADEEAEAREVASAIVAMAKDLTIGKEYIDVFYVLDAVLSGDKKAAINPVVAILSTGNAPSLIQKFAADLLRPQTQRQRGRPPHTRPSRWREIGAACQTLREATPPTKQVIAKVAHKYGMSESEVKKADTFYKKVLRNVDALIGHTGSFNAQLKLRK